jgi:hypothetical protein
MTRAWWAERWIFSPFSTAWRRWDDSFGVRRWHFWSGFAVAGLSLRGPERENAALRENAAQR